MNWFYDLKIGAKIISSFILVSLITALVGYVGLHNMGTINDLLGNLYTKHLVGLSDNKQANLNLIYYDRGLRNYILAKTKEDREERLRNMKIYEDRFRDNMEKVRASLVTDDAKETDNKIMAGLEGDAHAGNWHRQVSLLAIESIDKMRQKGLPTLRPGAFAENITTEFLNLTEIKIGTRLLVGKEAELEITQIGKQCHSKCAIFETVGDCVMPSEGIFARVIKGGEVFVSDEIIVCS
jgi:cyclic pyranopterin phosphate synthase